MEAFLCDVMRQSELTTLVLTILVHLELMMVGSHHAILLGYTPPSQKDWDLSSIRWGKINLIN